MPVFNYEKIFSSLFTWIKLGISIAVLVVLADKLVDVWQEVESSQQSAIVTTPNNL